MFINVVGEGGILPQKIFKEKDVRERERERERGGGGGGGERSVDKKTCEIAISTLPIDLHGFAHIIIEYD